MAKKSGHPPPPAQSAQLVQMVPAHSGTGAHSGSGGITGATNAQRIAHKIVQIAFFAVLIACCVSLAVILGFVDDGLEVAAVAVTEWWSNIDGPPICAIGIIVVAGILGRLFGGSEVRAKMNKFFDYAVLAPLVLSGLLLLGQLLIFAPRPFAKKTRKSGALKWRHTLKHGSKGNQPTKFDILKVSMSASSPLVTYRQKREIG